MKSFQNTIHQIKEAVKIWTSSQSIGQAILFITLGLIIVTNIRLISLIGQLDERLNTIDIKLERNSLQPFSASPADSSSVIVDVSWQNAPVRGSLDAPIQIVEFSDFQCPFCKASQSTLDLVLKKYEGRVLLAYRHFSLPMHEQAIPAAEAAECAREQNKFWEMHDLIFQNAQKLSITIYDSFADQVGLDLDKFKACISEHRYLDAILKDQKDGETYGITGTPTFFINGHMIEGSMDLLGFQEVIESLLTKTNP
ncbi:MAG: thioredoxin domain-containing protein [Chloroflexota bacterium]